MKRRMMKQAKFIDPSLGKAFVKQTKTIEGQWEKQIKTNEEYKKKQLYNKQPGNNELLLSKEREMFKNIYIRRLNKIHESFKTIDRRF